MPSTVPAVKAGLRNWLRTLPGLTLLDGVTIHGAPVGPDAPTTNLVVLGEVTAPQTFDVLAADGIKTERPTLTGWCVCTAAGTGDEAEDTARAGAYALFAVIEAAIEADPSAGGVIPGPMRAEVTESGLTEAAGAENEGGKRVAQIRWLLTWGSDF